MNCIFLYNPSSGKGKIKKKSGYIKSVLETKFTSVEVYETKSAEDTYNKAVEACGKYDALIFAGGDGTFNLIAGGIASQPNRPVLGYIPSGTVNDIARNLRISKNIKKALKVIIQGHTVYHDVGRINDHYFIYVAALGTFTSISYRTKQESKRLLGKMAYVFDAVQDIIRPSINKIKVEIDGQIEEHETPLILILNSYCVGGFPFNRKALLNDGRFDVMIVKKGVHKGFFNIIRLFLSGLFGFRNKRTMKYFAAERLTVETGPDCQWCIDGEAGPKGTVHVENLHNHFQIYIPVKRNKKIKSKKFQYILSGTANGDKI